MCMEASETQEVQELGLVLELQLPRIAQDPGAPLLKEGASNTDGATIPVGVNRQPVLVVGKFHVDIAPYVAGFAFDHDGSDLIVVAADESIDEPLNELVVKRTKLAEVRDRLRHHWQERWLERDR